VSIARIPDLSPEARNIESRAIEQVEKRLDALIDEYRQRFGVVVGTDLARELFPDYTA
jgi:tetrahydromethanopterin S-methyltransferase subunit G